MWVVEHFCAVSWRSIFSDTSYERKSRSHFGALLAFLIVAFVLWTPHAANAQAATYNYSGPPMIRQSFAGDGASCPLIVSATAMVTGTLNSAAPGGFAIATATVSAGSISGSVNSPYILFEVSPGPPANTIPAGQVTAANFGTYVYGPPLAPPLPLNAVSIYFMQYALSSVSSDSMLLQKYSPVTNGQGEIFYNLDYSCSYNQQVSSATGTWTGGPTQTPVPKNFGNGNVISNPSSPCQVASNDAAPTPHVSNPINVATGNKFQTETDIACAAHTGLNLTRYYNSQDTTASPFGKGWHSSWHHGLKLNGNTVTVTRGDGRQDIFTNNGAGVYTADADVTSTLTAVGSNGSVTGWQLKLADDSVETYLFGGQLASITTREGRTTTFAYDTNSNVTSVTGPFGHVMSFAYDASGHVSQARSPDGTVYAYTYDANNNLTSVTYPDGKRKQYLFENTAFPNALTGIIDENGVRFATYAYDTQGRAISTEHAGGAERTTVAYNADGTSTVTDANGNARTYTFATQFGMMKITALSGAPDPKVGGSAFTYDANGFLASRTDYAGNVTTFTHDARGNETSRTEAAGTALARTFTTSWNPTLHLPVQITEPGGRTTTFTYDTHGNLLTKTVASGPQTRTWQYAYNAAGQVTAMADPRGVVTRTTYDSKGDVATVTNALNQTASFTSYDGAGRLLRAVDANGLVTTFTYDARGRLLQRSEGGEKTQFAYDAAGNLIAAQRPDGSVISSYFDSAHRLTGMRDALGNAMSYALDGNDNRVQTGLYDPANNLVQRRAFGYDSVNRLTTELGAQNQQTDYRYDAQGNLTRVSDPLGHRTTFDYDALNRRVITTDAANGLTRFGYDALDRLTAQQDPKGLTTGYAYDGLDNQTGVASPDTGNTVKTYDAAGNVLTATDARGMKTTYTYDALNRVVQARYADNTSTTYQYDQGQYGVGHLTRMVDPAGVTQWAYDSHGRVIAKTQQVNGLTLTTRMAYDAAGRLSQLQYPSGKTVTYKYDAAGQVSGIALGNAWLISNIAYRPFGPAQSWKQGNNATFARTFDADGQLTGISMAGLATVTYVYDAAGRITGETESGVAGQAFGYDALDRLTAFVNGNAQTSYAYDADGNRLSLATPASGTTEGYAYNAASNRLLSVTEATTVLDRKNKPSTSTDIDAFIYDATGNTLSDGDHLFTYDARGRMASATTANDKTHRRFDDDRREQRRATLYGVNGLGERIAKLKAKDHDRNNFRKNDGIFYAYDGAGHLLGEYNERGRAIEETVYLGDTPIAVLKDDGDHDWDCDRNGKVFYIAADNLGAPHIITDERNRKVWQWNHAPFGDTEPVSSGNFTYDLRFPGQIADAESGLNNNGFRSYASSLGRYVQSDPIGLAAGVNTYGYVGQSPAAFSDRSGLCFGPLLAYCTYEALFWGGVAAETAFSWATGYISPTSITAEAASIGRQCPTIANSVPSNVARVIPGEGPFPTLGVHGAADVFTTDPAAISGMTPSQIAQRLGIPYSSNYTIYEFSTPQGIGSPVFRSNPGFVGGGQTSGGAPEFVIPNGPIPPGSRMSIIGE